MLICVLLRLFLAATAVAATVVVLIAAATVAIPAILIGGALATLGFFLTRKENTR